jgi:hypothetical protein
MNRRDFHKLAMAALGGALAGAELAGDLAGAQAAEAKAKPKDPKKSYWLQEPHICRGLNTCKGKGKGGKNKCAGQGACATVKAHTCAGDNECKGLGGCGKTPGENACKGKGSCGVPMEMGKKAWLTARKSFETALKKAGKKFGPAPAK